MRVGSGGGVGVPCESEELSQADNKTAQKRKRIAVLLFIFLR